MTRTGSSRPVEAVQLGAPRAAQPDLPGLDRVGAKLVRALQDALSTHGSVLKLACGEVRTMTLGEWKAGLGTPTAVARYRSRALKSGMMLSVPPLIVASIVDRFYGGSGAIESVRAAFSIAEQRYFERFAERLVASIGAAWADIIPIEASLTSCAFSREDVTFAKDDIRVAVQQFACDGFPPIEFVYGLAALRAIAGLNEDAGDAEAVETDPVWAARMSDAVMQTRLPVRTVLARPELPLSQLLRLAPGDVIPVTLPARVPVTVAGRLLGHGTIGEANGRAAIKIDSIQQGALVHG